MGKLVSRSLGILFTAISCSIGIGNLPLCGNESFAEPDRQKKGPGLAELSLADSPFKQLTLAYSADGKQVIVCQASAIQIFDSANGKLIQSIKTNSLCMALPVVGEIATAERSLERKICIWDAISGKQLRSVQAHPCGTMILCSSSNGKILGGIGAEFDLALKKGGPPGWQFGIRVWDSTSGELLKTFEPGFHRARHIALAPDGKSLAFATFAYEKLIRVVNVPDGNELFKIDDVPLCSYSPDSKLLLCGSTLYDSVTGKEVRKLKEKSSKPSDPPLYVLVLHGGFTHDGKTIFTVDIDAVTTWDAETGNKVASVKLPAPFLKMGWGAYRRCLQ